MHQYTQFHSPDATRIVILLHCRQYQVTNSSIVHHVYDYFHNILLQWWNPVGLVH